MARLSSRQELAVVLVLSGGEPLGRAEVGNGPAGEDERGFIAAMASVELALIEREWSALERWLGYLVGSKVEDESERARLVEDCQLIGWYLLAPTEAS